MHVTTLTCETSAVDTSSLRYDSVYLTCSKKLTGSKLQMVFVSMSKLQKKNPRTFGVKTNGPYCSDMLLTEQLTAVTHETLGEFFLSSNNTVLLYITLIDNQPPGMGDTCFHFIIRYNTIRYDSVNLTFSKKLTGSQLSLPHEIKQKIKMRTKNKLMSVIGLVQSHYHEGSSVGKRSLLR